MSSRLAKARPLSQALGYPPFLHMTVVTDQHFFNQLIQSHYQDLYRFAFSLVKNADDAADLVQTTFTIWAQKGHQLQDMSKAKSWLFTTLHREFIDLYRKLQRAPQALEATEVEQLPSADQLPEIAHDARIALQALDALDPLYADPLRLFYLSDLNYREIAEALHVPIGTIMSRLSRGKAHIRELLIATPVPVL